MPEVTVHLIEYTCEATKNRIYYPESLSGLDAMERARDLKDAVVHILKVNPMTFEVVSSSQI